MKIRLLSDIHLEFYDNPVIYESKGEELLIIAGDLTVGGPNVWKALEKFAAKTQHVLYTSGNHEYYGSSIKDFDEYIISKCHGTNIKYLNPGKVIIDDITFIGANGWTNFDDGDEPTKLAAKKGINDFKVVDGFTTSICQDLSNEHYKFIFDNYYKSEGKCVIFTHFLPARECISEQYKNTGGILNKYFSNNFGEVIAKMQDTTWLFGHTHDVVDISIGNTRLIANPYGYYKNHNYIERIIEV